MHLRTRLAFIVLVLLLVIPACGAVAALKVTKHNIMVTEYTADMSQSAAIVEGQAQNTLPWPLDKCKICVTFYDYEGKSLGVFSDSIERLDPGQVWNFRVGLKGGDAWKVARYDVSVCN